MWFDDDHDVEDPPYDVDTPLMIGAAAALAGCIGMLAVLVALLS
jgi:hypothetical protein